MGGTTNIVKNSRYRRPEPFDREKLQKSIVAACLSAGAPAGHSDSIARRVVGEVATWAEIHPEITSNDVRRVAARYLRAYHPDASYLYEHHHTTF